MKRYRELRPEDKEYILQNQINEDEEEEGEREEMEEEFFWYVDTAAGKLSSLGLTVETTRFSRLSWGIKAL